MGNFAVGVDPEKGVFDAGAGGVVGGLVYADGDGEGVGFGFGAETEEEGGFVGGLAEGEGFRGRGADVVGCFGEEEGLRWWLGGV